MSKMSKRQSKRPKPLVPKRKKSVDAYARAVCDDSLQDLGERIHTFRNMIKIISKKDTITEPELLKMIDSIYQAALDEIFDSLSDAGDLKIGNLACNGIATSMLIRRGFIKKTKAFE
jgi:hypothetical protein